MNVKAGEQDGGEGGANVAGTVQTNSVKTALFTSTHNCLNVC